MLRPPPPPRQSTLISNFQQNLANQNGGAPPPPPPKSSASSVISVSSNISTASNSSSSSSSSSNGNGSGSGNDDGRKTSNAGGGGGGGGGPPRIPMSLPTSSSSSNTSIPGPPPKPSGSPSSTPTSSSTSSSSSSSSSIPRFGNQTLPQTAVRFGTVTFGGAGAVTVPPPPAKLINSSSSSSSSASSISTSSNMTGTGPPPPPAKSNSTFSSSPTLSSSSVTSPLSSPLSTPRTPNGSFDRNVLPSLSFSSSSSSTPSSSQPSTPTSVSFRSSLTPTNGTNLGNRPPPPPAKSSLSTSTSSTSTGKISSSLLAQHNSMYGSSNNLYGMNKNSNNNNNNNNNDDNESTVSGTSDSGDDKFSSYRPRITIYERQEFRQPQSSSRSVAAEAFRQCEAPMCFQMAEFEGLCINHYYSNNLSDSASPSSTPTSTTSPSSSPFLSPSFPSRIGPPPAPTRSNSNSNSGNKQVNEEERRKLAEEFLTTEKSYGQGLKSIVRGFILRLNKHAELDKAFLTQDEMSKIFLNIQDIFDLNRRMLKDLKRMKSEGTLVSQLGKTLLSYTPFLRIYIQYVSNYDDGNKLIVALRERKPEFEFFLRLSELCEGQRLHDFLIQPVQRIPRYLLLLKGVQKNTDPSDPSYESIKQATIAVEKVATEINESFFWKEARQRVVDVQNHLEGCTIPLVTPTRFHVKDGGLRKKYNNTGFKINTFKKYWFFLFNDLLLYTTIPNAKGDCKLKYILPLLDMSVTDLPDDPNAKFMWEIKGSVKSFVVAAGSLEEKMSWVTTLNKYIEMLKANNKTLKLAPNMNPLNEYTQQENNVIEAMRDGGFL